LDQSARSLCRSGCRSQTRKRWFYKRPSTRLFIQKPQLLYADKKMRHDSIGEDHETRRKAWSIVFGRKNKRDERSSPPWSRDCSFCMIVHFGIHCRHTWNAIEQPVVNSSLTIPMMTCRKCGAEPGWTVIPAAMVGGDFDCVVLRDLHTFPIRFDTARSTSPQYHRTPTRWPCASLVHWGHADPRATTAIRSYCCSTCSVAGVARLFSNKMSIFSDRSILG
jgi:hypothetical protein